MPTPPGHSIFVVRITLEDVDPPVWRRLLVPGSVRVGKLHDMFQAAMGWNNSHLHSFTIGGQRYGMHLDDYPEAELDENDVTTLGAIGDHQHFSYEYDFGDGWLHEIRVEQRTATRRGLKYAVCLDGQNACPPEDCGGPGGYEQLLAVLADPEHEDHDDMRDWLGEPFDPRFFDLAAVNVALQQIR